MKKEFRFKKSILKHFCVSLIPFFIFVSFEGSGAVLLAPFDRLLTFIDSLFFAESNMFEVFSISLVVLLSLLYLAASVSSFIYKKAGTVSMRKTLEFLWTLLMMPITGLFNATSLATLVYALFVILFLPFS